jgi:hypothetical protein
MENKKLTDEELKKIQDMNADLTKAKIAIGDLEIKKQGIFKYIETSIQDFYGYEKILVEKYGADSIVDLATGEITEKDK